jgi:hypothetical protein
MDDPGAGLSAPLLDPEHPIHRVTVLGLGYRLDPPGEGPR